MRTSWTHREQFAYALPLKERSPTFAGCHLLPTAMLMPDDHLNPPPLRLAANIPRQAAAPLGTTERSERERHDPGDAGLRIMGDVFDRLAAERAARSALRKVREGLALSWDDLGRYLDAHGATLERWAMEEEEIPSPRLLILALERLLELHEKNSSS